MNYKKCVAEFLATSCYIGKIKIAPGTFGSLPAFLICFIIMHFVLKNQIVFAFAGLNYIEKQILTLFLISLGCTIALFIIGTYSISIHIEDSADKDPGEVVIDETVGQMLTIILSSFSVFLTYNLTIQGYLNTGWLYFILIVLLPFILFRFFDILKPWPINWLDQKIKGALGVMLDDIVAAIFASITQYVIIFSIIDFLPRGNIN